MRPRKKPLKSRLAPREIEICQRLAEARSYLGIDQDAAARKIGIPKSTLSNYELCVVPLKVQMALRICRHLILSEEWLATGRTSIAEKVGIEKGIKPTPDMTPIYIRQCMDLAGVPEITLLPVNKYFSQVFDEILAPIYEDRIRHSFYRVGISSSVWENTSPDLGFDILDVMIKRFMLLLENESRRRGLPKEKACSTYLGVLIRMSWFTFDKCMGNPVDAQQYGIPADLFTDANSQINAFGEKVSHKAHDGASRSNTQFNSPCR